MPCRVIVTGALVDYQLVYDPAPSQIEPGYWFYALFLGIGLAMVLVALVSRGRWSGSTFMLIFSAFWLSFSGLMTFEDIQDTHRIRGLIERGAYTTIAGCLDYFRPGSFDGTRSSDGNESWSVQGTEFDYGQGEVRRGYDLVEPRGGVVHRDTKVRVSFVISDLYDRKEIVKLAVAQHACPAAPNPNT